MNEYLLACPVKSATGVDCPGCGFQRAFVLLIEGQFSESVAMYPALLPVLLTVTLLIWHLIVKRPRSAYIVMWSFILTMAIVTCSYVVKQLQQPVAISCHDHHNQGNTQ